MDGMPFAGRITRPKAQRAQKDTLRKEIERVLKGWADADDDSSINEESAAEVTERIMGLIAKLKIGEQECRNR